MKTEKRRKLLIVGICGCLMYVIGDFLYAATGKGQTTESIGLLTKLAYLEMSTWRMWASILCGFVGTLLYYMGFTQMYDLLKIHITDHKNRIWVKMFHVSYIMGTVAWSWVHASFMTNALIFKYVYEAYGDGSIAADIANRVLYANAPGMIIAYIICDVGLAIIMITLVWKGIIPLKNTGTRILATFCNPIVFAGVIGNVVAMLPWPVNQLDHGSESFGHALVLVLGMVLLKEMTKSGEISE